ncbi:MAG: NAD(P)-dependent oxidoreductase [Polyangiaceae bacterium]
MRLLVADAFPEKLLATFAPLGFVVDYAPKLTAEQLPAAIGDAQVLIVRSTKVKRPVFDASKKLELVIRAGAGIDNIDVKAASERGIYVANCPGKNSVAVAELTMGLMLALDRRIADTTHDLRTSVWNKTTYAKADGIKGKTMGIVGFGAIGRLVAARANAFDLDVLIYNEPPILDEEAEELGVTAVGSLAELAEKSDIVSMHVPSLPGTQGLCNAAFFAKMKPGAIFINTSRGSIHDEGALVAAMKEKGIRVGLDVFANEPAAGAGEFSPEIATLPGFVGTHHIGASTEQAQNAIAAECVRICREFAATGLAPNVVNIERHSPAKLKLIVRHYDKVGVLANVLGIVRNHKLNVEEMTNTIFEGARTAVAVVRLSEAPTDEVVEEIAALTDQVISVDVK